jgi:hypothetical protein
VLSPVEYTYEPFGATTASGLADANPFQYTGTGRENDGTGLYCYQSRHYHPRRSKLSAGIRSDSAVGDVNVHGCGIEVPWEVLRLSGGRRADAPR